MLSHLRKLFPSVDPNDDTLPGYRLRVFRTDLQPGPWAWEIVNARDEMVATGVGADQPAALAAGQRIMEELFSEWAA